jgi:SAM-dependent methyltransferase
VEELRGLVAQKHGDPATAGWGVRRRHRFGFFTPDDHYEALVRRFVEPGTRWLDVGGGTSVFPHNAALAGELSQRAALLVGVDPSANIHNNRFVHGRVQSAIEEYQSSHRFDLATLRMVVEHIVDPRQVMQALRTLVVPGGRVIIFTVNKWSPISLMSKATPFGLHHPLKKRFWGGEEKDTFPVQYLLNTRRDLRAAFHRGGFEESAFMYLDDLATFSQFRALNWMELQAWRILRALRLRYPETCLLGVYRHRPE